MHRILICAASVAVLLVVGTSKAGAQQFKLTCSGDLAADCTHTVGFVDSVQKVNMTITVSDGAGVAVTGAIVRFSATSGIVEPDSIVADTTGEVRAVWIRGKGGDQIAIGVSAQLDRRGNGIAFVRLLPTSPAQPKGIRIEELDGFQQSWFEKSQLPRELSVKLTDGYMPLDEQTCIGNRILFKGRGAPQSVSPDTAVARWDKGNCYASTFWTLGEGMGERRMDVSVVPGKGYKGANELKAYAWARATPKFITGFAFGGHTKPYVGKAADTTRVVNVQKTMPDGSILRYDTAGTTEGGGPKNVKEEHIFSAVAAVSIPIPIARWGRLDGLSLTAGVDLAHPTQRQFYGFSVVRFGLGRLIPVIEVLPVDLHLLAFFAREEPVENEGCGPGSCETRKRTRYQSLALMISADAAALAADLVKKLIE